jgi:GntR family transcriptional regulator, transcriptional repressor for pyruvate dehydrogenase complex
LTDISRNEYCFPKPMSDSPTQPQRADPNPKTYEVVARRLIQDVADGTLAPGAAVPAEVKVAEALGVGRSSVREALRMLESRGLIMRAAGGRFSVANGAHPLVEAFELLYDLNRIDVVELFDLRELVETEAAARAAERHGDDDIRKLSEALGSMQWGASTPDKLYEADTRFHIAVAEATGNRAAARLVEALRLTLRDTLHAPLFARTGRDDWSSATVAEHIAIFEAITAHDVEGARAAMAKHLRRVTEQAVSILERTVRP